jgi:hypothetical protein
VERLATVYCHTKYFPYNALAKLHLGRDKKEAPSCMAEGHIRLKQDVRTTKCNVQGILPPQDSSSTLVASMASVWNVMLSEIKEEGDQSKWKRQIRSFAANRDSF